MNKLISIIMPAYNAEKFIKLAVESIISQTYKQWELLIIDDGSTDSTASIIEDLRKLDERIFYYFQQNSKQGKARNHGIQKAKGKLIAFLDADDLWLPNKLEVLIEAFDEDQYDLIFSDAFIFKSELDLAEIRSSQNIFHVVDAVYVGESGLREFLIFNRIPLLTTLMKKQILTDVGMFSDLGICEDYEMWLKLLINDYKFKSISLPLAAYRIHENATTANDKLAINQCIDVIYNLSKRVSNKYRQLFPKALRLWYSRKLDDVSSPLELDKLIQKMVNHGNQGLTIKLVSKINFPLFFYFNKNLIYNLLK